MAPGTTLIQSGWDRDIRSEVPEGETSLRTHLIVYRCTFGESKSARDYALHILHPCDVTDGSCEKHSQLGLESDKNGAWLKSAESINNVKSRIADDPSWTPAQESIVNGEIDSSVAANGGPTMTTGSTVSGPNPSPNFRPPKP